MLIRSIERGVPKVPGLDYSGRPEILIDIYTKMKKILKID